MDLITPVKSWLQSLDDDRLSALLEWADRIPGYDTNRVEFIKRLIDGIDYQCPLAWVRQEVARRAQLH